MSRAPIEDCLDLIPNRFELCAVASKRARQLARGAASELPWHGHKVVLQSLYEIAAGHVDRAVLSEQDPPTVEPVSMLFEDIESSIRN